MLCLCLLAVGECQLLNLNIHTSFFVLFAIISCIVLPVPGTPGGVPLFEPWRAFVFSLDKVPLRVGNPTFFLDAATLSDHWKPFSGHPEWARDSPYTIMDPFREGWEKVFSESVHLQPVNYRLGTELSANFWSLVGTGDNSPTLGSNPSLTIYPSLNRAAELMAYVGPYGLSKSLLGAGTFQGNASIYGSQGKDYHIRAKGAGACLWQTQVTSEAQCKAAAEAQGKAFVGKARSGKDHIDCFQIDDGRDEHNGDFAWAPTSTADRHNPGSYFNSHYLAVCLGGPRKPFSFSATRYATQQVSLKAEPTGGSGQYLYPTNALAKVSIPPPPAVTPPPPMWEAREEAEMSTYIGEKSYREVEADLLKSIRSGELDYKRPSSQLEWAESDRTGEGLHASACERPIRDDDDKIYLRVPNKSPETSVFTQTNNIVYKGRNIQETIGYRWCRYIDQISMRAYKFRLLNSPSVIHSVMTDQPLDKYTPNLSQTVKDNYSIDNRKK